MGFLDAFVGGVVIALIALYVKNWYQEVEYVESSVDGHRYLVRKAENSQDAANILARINKQVERLIEHLMVNYPSDPRTLMMRERYDRNSLSEGGRNSGYTSFSVNKLRYRDAYYEEKQLSSSAMGHNHNMLITIPGRVNVDLIHVVRKEYKFTSYSLNNVSRSVLKDEKDDVSAKDIFRLQDGSDDDRAVIAKYCVQDCALVTRLAERLTVVINAIAMSNVCSVPLQYIFSRGQGIKCTSQVAKVCRERGFLMKTLPRDAENLGFRHP
jgi:hypothetical protein